MSTTINRIAAIMHGELPPPPIAQLLGFRITAVERGRVVLQMEAGPQHANPMGTLHGGVFCDLADGAMGMAYATTLADDEAFTTLELKINFLRPVWNATLTAEGRVIQSGKSVGLVECDLTDERGRLVARATSTCMTLRGEKAEGRRAVYDAAAAR
jgi:uncharacterized protein (TIGR00369 family)